MDIYNSKNGYPLIELVISIGLIQIIDIYKLFKIVDIRNSNYGYQLIE